ncbi:hypothetical protein GCM10011348_46150 [Marinobacterium nitratireducens]|uniref:SEC-C motif-containing protein n=1 Tax=Marinobacterium nitratireducens TaxID=518897 RepID=A0A917ZS19_9GAMM|nr:SEC-C metal-binding domain-containing protein [Marinobacterium nitratireducens]GGO89127.1 hypothetical protein GCM10011348_46150 [Marinobacterium nitratireducens]
MNIDTGQIHHFDSEEALRAFKKDLAQRDQRLVELSDHEARTLKPMSNGRRKNWMRNQPCPCGSGSKFKKCCWSSYS